MKKISTYWQLTPSEFKQETEKSDKILLIEFSASWCGHSQIMKPIIDSYQTQFKNKFKTIRLCIENNKRLAEQLGIQSYPAFLFYKEGKIVDAFFHSLSRNSFEKRLIKLFYP